jgi:hypothetical protein
MDEYFADDVLHNQLRAELDEARADLARVTAIANRRRGDKKLLELHVKFLCSVYKDLTADLARAEGERDEAQSERQREHDLRVRLQGENESFRAALQRIVGAWERVSAFIAMSDSFPVDSAIVDARELLGNAPAEKTDDGENGEVKL